VKREIKIFGAGLSGLTASINLAREGYDVVLYEKEKRIGGLDKCTPSIHMTPLHFQKMKEFIGIDIESCFSELDSFKAYIYAKTVLFNPKHLYVTERGPNKTSLENFLYKIAIEEGVNFEFSHPLKKEMIHSIPKNSIIAVGGCSSIWQDLNIRFIPFIHFDSYKKIQQKNNFCLTYFDSYLVGYGYIAAKDGLASVTVAFMLNQPYNEYLKKFKNHIKEDKFEFDKWSLVRDNFPEKIYLFKKIHGKTQILTGAVSGFLDPFFGFGVNSSLTSGKIAALAVTSKEKGIKEFRRFTRNLNRMFILSRVYDFMPLRNEIIEKLFRNTGRGLPIIKKNMKSIPGFTHDDCFKIQKIIN